MFLWILESISIATKDPKNSIEMAFTQLKSYIFHSGYPPSRGITSISSQPIIYPQEQNGKGDDGEESLDVWGFTDTQFRTDSYGVVEVTGTRYPLSGKKLPSLLPWISNIMEVEVSNKSRYPSNYPPHIPISNTEHPFISDLGMFLKESQIALDSKQRLRHGHGHSQGEMYAIKYGTIKRVPDMIVYPENDVQVVNLVDAAVKHRVCLIPFGGGTNVSEALECPVDEQRTIVSVDMRQMHKIRWIDPVNRTACIEAGAVGRHILEDLAKHGYTLGHEPDSLEFSTLGGWVATNASGMKKNKYGNIEDIVLDINLVTTQGILKGSKESPRESVGSDLRRLVFGSEGNIGIITSAIVKIFPLPEVQKYGSILFPTFEDGVEFMYELAQSGAQPASVRLVDNYQFQLSMALKPVSTGIPAIISQIQKAYVTKIKGFDPNKMVACTLVFEGVAATVQQQESTVYKLASNHRGMKAGAENGERGYMLTYNIAYIRDFGLTHYILAESFETSVPWRQVLQVCERVKTRLYKEHQKRELPGKPFVTCRVTQLYDTGAAVYFYFAFFFKGVANPSDVYREMETAARDEILLCGGALSHHHGVGKLRKELLPRVLSGETLHWYKQFKDTVDPTNVFGARNMITEI